MQALPIGATVTIPGGYYEARYHVPCIGRVTGNTDADIIGYSVKTPHAEYASAEYVTLVTDPAVIAAFEAYEQAHAALITALSTL